MTNTSAISMSAFWTTRSAILFSILVVLKPGVPFLTTKALTWPVSLDRAQTMTTSDHVALPIQRLRPLSFHPPGTLVAVVCSAAASDPLVGSVSAQAPDGLELRHPGQPLALLLLRAQQVDGQHGQRGVHQQEGAAGGVDPRGLDDDHGRAEQGQSLPCLRVLDHAPPDAQSAQLGDDLERERGLFPVVRDDGRDLGLHEGPDAVAHGPLLRGQEVVEGEDVVRRRREVRTWSLPRQKSGRWG